MLSLAAAVAFSGGCSGTHAANTQWAARTPPTDAFGGHRGLVVTPNAVFGSTSPVAESRPWYAGRNDALPRGYALDDRRSDLPRRR